MSQEPLIITAPYSGEELGRLPRVSWDHINQALTRAVELHQQHPYGLPLHQRIDILGRLAALMREQRDALALQAAREGGKPLRDSQVEADRAIDGIELCIETLRSDQGEVVPMGGTAAGAGRLAFTQREPIGPVVAVSAFNHPLNLIVHQAGAAIAAGCPVLVKPAEDTPLSAASFVKLAHQAGLPEDWCQLIIPDSLETASRMVSDERVAFFSFIGSARVGWMLRSKLAPGARCALEHGGVAPLFVTADADLDAAIPAIAKGGFYHAGQVCVSVQRVFVERAIADELVQRLKTAAEKLVVGDPADEATEVGPLIRPGEVDRVAEWVAEAIADGARCVLGGQQLDHQCYAPTILVNPPTDVRISQQEVFGPVVCIYPYDDLDAAIAQANALPYAFQAAVFSNSLETVLKIYRQVKASAVMANDHTAFRVDGMPFAGLKQSGLGVGGIPHTIRDMQVEKMLVVKSGLLV
ncbi:MAG: aldehyde dehydrogenase family protein [Wenzhouxiangellaceae bacterium]